MDLRESISMQNQISITLAKHVISTISKPSNVIFSPASINVILSKIAAGSTGSTKSVKMMINSIPRKCECFDLYDQLIPYKKAWSWQKQIIKEKTSLINNNQYCQDTLILLQHPPVYTMGIGSKEDYLNFDIKDAPYDIYRTERGGEVTYHGPGQLVMYPIINLRSHKMDLHWYLRMLEEVVIRVLYSAFDIKATRLDGLTGVWVGNQKVAAIGIRVSKWMTYHGLALNVTTDLTPFKWIVPCGIRDRKVGSIKGLIMDREHIKMDDVQLIDIAHKSLLKEFSKVFHLQIEKQTNIFIPLQC